MAAPSSILVLGAGELGIEVLKSLASHPLRSHSRLAVMLRPATFSSQDPAKLADLDLFNSLGIETISGDVVEDAAEQLSAIFASFHTIISCTGMTFPKGTQLKIATAVLQAGVKRYFPWQFGIDYDKIGRNSGQDLFDEQLDVRDLLRSQEATQWVIVSTGMFISFLFEPAFGIVDLIEGSVTVIGSWENALTVTAPADIGRLTAEIALAAPEKHGVVYVAGDTGTMQRLADLVERLLGRKIVRRLKTLPGLRQELDDDPHDVMRKYRAVFGAGVGVAWDKESSFNGQRSIPTVSVEQWARENVAPTLLEKVN